MARSGRLRADKSCFRCHRPSRKSHRSEFGQPWDSSCLPTSPYWTSNQGTNTSTLSAVSDTLAVTKQTLTVDIPTTGSGPQGPTGQVANTTSSFQVTVGGVTAAARFIFADLNGTISGWNG